MHSLKLILNKFYYFFLILLLYGCGPEEAKKSKSPDHIVLIVDRCPNYSVYKTKTGSISSEDDIEISYMDDDLILHTYCTASEPTRDTLVFPAGSKMIEIEHEYKNIEKISFLFYQGDTVLFTYDQDFPVATVLNRPQDSLSTNYVKLRRTKLLIDGDEFEGMALFRWQKSRLFYHQVKNRLWGEAGKLYNSEKTLELLEELEVYNKLEMELLDSLLSSRLIAFEFYIFYKQKNEIEFAFAENQYLNGLPKSLVDEPGPAQYYEWELPDSIRNNLIRYGYYNKILSNLEFKKYHTNVPKLKFTARKIPDYRYVYDSITQSALFTINEKKILQTNCIKKIIEHFPEDDITRYFKIYKEDVQSDALVAHVANEYQDLIPEALLNEIDGISTVLLTDSSYKLSLLNILGEQVEFQDFLKKYRGKIVYLDIWSSTCLPCLIAMPHSIQLERDYVDKDIQFIFISMDKDQEKWKKSMGKIMLNSTDASFMIDPNGNNTMLEGLNIQYIPRYLLFDKTGKLVQYRAFSPRSENVRATFDKYLGIDR